MPLYEYRCKACERTFELIRKFSDPELDVCALCGKGPIERLLSSPAIQFKGSGWYITDYSQKGKANSETSTPPSANSSKSETPASSTSATSTDASPPAKKSKGAD